MQCQLANEDDLQSKSVIKETVFSIRIDYRCNDFKQKVLFLEIHSPLMYIVHFSKDYTKTPLQLRRQGAKNVYFREVTIKDISSSFIVCWKESGPPPLLLSILYLELICNITATLFELRYYTSFEAQLVSLLKSTTDQFLSHIQGYSQKLRLQRLLKTLKIWYFQG